MLEDSYSVLGYDGVLTILIDFLKTPYAIDIMGRVYFNALRKTYMGTIPTCVLCMNYLNRLSPCPFDFGDEEHTIVEFSKSESEYEYEYETETESEVESEATPEVEAKIKATPEAKAEIDDLIWSSSTSSTSSLTSTIIGVNTDQSNTVLEI